MLNTLDDPKIDWLGKRVFCRLDLNVPLNAAGEITDFTRIEAALPTLNFLLGKGVRLVVGSHLGRPKGKARAELSLAPVAEHLQALLNREVIFAQDCIGDGIKRLIHELKPGGLLVLENLRFHSSEEKNEESFAKLLAQNIDVYVNDAFGAVHRPHASVDAITRFIPLKYAGFLLVKELEALTHLSRNAQQPFVLVIGGSKVTDKIGAIAQLLSKTETLMIGGAMAYTFLKAKGVSIGASRYEENRLALASALLQKASSLGVQVLLPKDHVVVSEFSAEAIPRAVERLEEGDIGIDIGPQTRVEYERALHFAKTIFWNGPVGVFEWDSGFEGTRSLIQAIAANPGFKVIGGADSIAALHKTGVDPKQITHISTGGGASLEFLQGAELPGLVALERA